MNQVHIVSLTYGIMWDDSDAGSCCAGEGARIVRVFQDKHKAEDFVRQWSPVICAAEKETIVFPRQKHNTQLRAGIGFDLHDLQQGLENFALKIESREVEAPVQALRTYVAGRIRKARSAAREAAFNGSLKALSLHAVIDELRTVSRTFAARDRTASPPSTS